MENKIYLYRPNYLRMIFAGLVFGTMSYFAAFTSHVGNGPRIIAILLENIGLDLGQVVRIAGIVGLLMTAMLLIILVYSAISKPRQIEISDHSILLPSHTFSARSIEIRLEDLLRVNITDTFGQQFIRIDHKAGSAVLPRNMFANNNSFIGCYTEMLSNIR